VLAEGWHGSIDPGAIEQSCDVFFYTVGSSLASIASASTTLFSLGVKSG
jgi:hypothetical protein